MNSTATATHSFNKMVFWAFLELALSEEFWPPFNVSKLNVRGFIRLVLTKPGPAATSLTRLLDYKVSRRTSCGTKTTGVNLFPSMEEEKLQELGIEPVCEVEPSACPRRSIVKRMPACPLCLSMCSDRRDIQYYTSMAARMPNCHSRRKP